MTCSTICWPVLVLIGAGRSGDVDDLVDALLELAEVEGPVVEGGRQPEAEVDEDLFARPVAAVHRPDLGQGHVGLVDEQQVVLGEVVEKGVRGASRRTLRQVPGVVLHTAAVAGLAEHFQVVVGPGLQSLGLEQLSLVLELHQSLVQLILDG